MVVEILAFGIAKDIVGKRSVRLDVGKSSTAAELKKTLLSEYPGLRDLPDFMIAINSHYAHGSRRLDPDDEIAIIPPTNGG